MKRLAVTLLLLFLGPLAAVGGTLVLTTDSAAALRFFPGAQGLRQTVVLSPPQLSALRNALAGYRQGGPARDQDHFSVLEMRKGQALLGWVVTVDEIGKHQLITFAIGVAVDGAVAGVELLEYRENYGIQIKEGKFLNQFRGKHWSDPLKTPGDIDAVSGATYSSFAANRAVRKTLGLLMLLGKIGNDAKK